MPKTTVRELSLEQIKAIEATVAKGDRAEVVPVGDGLKILHVKREEVKTASQKAKCRQNTNH